MINSGNSLHSNMNFTYSDQIGSGHQYRIPSIPKVTNSVNSLQLPMTKATKRIPVTSETLQKIKMLGHKGQTYDDLLNEMMEAYKKEKFLKLLEERKKEGEFQDFDEAFQ